jgi:hypothetical protein
MKAARAMKTKETGQYPKANGIIASKSGIKIYGRPSRATMNVSFPSNVRQGKLRIKRC